MCSFSGKAGRGQKIFVFLFFNQLFQATYTCSGDSGSPLVSSNQLIGILHGSNRKKCVFSLLNTPSLFANVTYAENTNFIRNWISLGATLDYQNDPLFNYLKSSTNPDQPKINLWATYISAALASSINETQQYMELQVQTTMTNSPGRPVAYPSQERLPHPVKRDIAFEGNNHAAFPENLLLLGTKGLKLTIKFSTLYPHGLLIWYERAFGDFFGLGCKYPIHLLE